MQLHKDLFDANYWKRLQSNIRRVFEDVYPLPAQEALSFPAGMTLAEVAKGTPWRPLLYPF